MGASRPLNVGHSLPLLGCTRPLAFQVALSALRRVALFYFNEETDEVGELALKSWAPECTALFESGGWVLLVCCGLCLSLLLAF